MKILYLICYTSFIIGIILFILMWYFETKKSFNLKPTKKKNFAILIPARDESKVIESLLISIKGQVKDFKSTYIIVESSKDKTCKIAKKYGANIIIRKNIENRKRKGYALDEAIKDILKKQKYDLYFIFDADNILESNFIEEMLKTYANGYDIALGYRNIKNSTNAISTCSGLIFSMINTIVNKGKQKIHNTMIISGTGYYISGRLINKWKGFPFHSLTEDYELSLYASANNISTDYNEKAIYYDEQPTDMKTSIKQRARWIKGFFESRSIRLKEIIDDYTKIIGIIPYLFLIIGVLGFLILNLVETITLLIASNNLYIYTLQTFIYVLIIIYLVLFVFTIILIIKERNKINISLKQKIIAIFFNPIFLATFLISLLKVIFNKNLGWDKIEHKEKKLS